MVLFPYAQSGSQWTVGEITTADGINTCSAHPGDSAVRMAEQIGAKVLER